MNTHTTKSHLVQGDRIAVVVQPRHLRNPDQQGAAASLQPLEVAEEVEEQRS